MHLFLSPHFDDVVFSCGGYISCLNLVTVLTIMAGDPPAQIPQSPLIQELHDRWASGENPVAIRRAEDQTALLSLGAEAIYLTVPDCIYRTHNNMVLYPNDDDDLFGTIHINDPAKSQLDSYSLLAHFPMATTIVAPLAIGNHVDHQIVRDWALDLLENNPTLNMWFFEDYPYSSNLEAIRQTVDNFPVQLEASVQPIDTQSVEAKCNAIMTYRSQISTFWTSESHMRENIHQHMKQIGKGSYAERYWLPK